MVQRTQRKTSALRTAVLRIPNSIKTVPFTAAGEDLNHPGFAPGFRVAGTCSNCVAGEALYFTKG